MNDNMNIFDTIHSGISDIKIDNGQISLSGYLNSDIELPPIDTQLGLELSTKSKHNAKQINVYNIKTIPNVQKKVIKLSSIKTVQENEKSKQPIKKITMINFKSDMNNVLTLVSSKSKQDMEKRNEELLKIRQHPYIKKQSILTTAEKKCYKFLLQHLGDKVIILSKVRLADVVELNELVTRDTKAFFKIAYKHLDYVILSKDLDLICAVELDDYTHDTEKAKERDQFVAEVLLDCGIPFFRIKTKVDLLTTLDIKAIEMCVLEYLAPTCPVCGRPMEPKMSSNKRNYGHKFYGCLGWYEKEPNKCHCTIDID